MKTQLAPVQVGNYVPPVVPRSPVESPRDRHARYAFNLLMGLLVGGLVLSLIVAIVL